MELQTRECQCREVAERLADALDAEVQAEESYSADPMLVRRIEECRAAVKILLKEYDESVIRCREDAPR